MTTATIAGTTPTERTDGTPLDLTDVASIDVFDDIGAGAQKIGTIANPATTFAYTTGVLKAGILHSFSVVVNDIKGHSSAVSNVAQLQVPATLAAPNAVNDLTATLNPDTPAPSTAPAPPAS